MGGDEVPSLKQTNISQTPFHSRMADEALMVREGEGFRGNAVSILIELTGAFCHISLLPQTWMCWLELQLLSWTMR